MHHCMTLVWVQGRARPSLAKLYNWRYQALGDLPAVTQEERFRRANPGLAFDCQFIGTLIDTASTLCMPSW